jgi:hypothetical protein
MRRSARANIMVDFWKNLSWSPKGGRSRPQQSCPARAARRRQPGDKLLAYFQKLVGKNMGRSRRLQQFSDDVAFGMFESIGERSKFLVRHANNVRGFMPARHGMFHLGQNVPCAVVRDAEIRNDGHECIDAHVGARAFGWLPDVIQKHTIHGETSFR